MKYFETIILGGGSSGCMCAMMSNSNSMAIIDSNPFLAKKLLATGNGRCNLTNIDCELSYYNTAGIKEYLNQFNQNDTLQFFNKIGLVTFADEKGRVYPLSNSAKSVVDVINNYINKKKVTTFLNTFIDNIVINKEGQFELLSNNERFCCDKLVIATGGKTLLNFLDSNNIKYREFFPSLCAIRTQNTHYLNNVKLHDVKISAKNYKGRSKSEFGEILFKESGLSGIAIFNVSSLFARENYFKGYLEIDLLPNFSKKDVKALLNYRKTLELSISNFFDGLFVREIGWEILNRCKINENRLSNQLTDDEIDKMVYAIKSLEFKVNGHYDNNQIYSGGVLLDNLTSSLEHKTIKNLYFCGEICDVDGECGGFNLQWAWTSGAIIGKNI